MNATRVLSFGSSGGHPQKRERTVARSIFDRLNWWKLALMSGLLLSAWSSAAAQVAVRIPDCQRDLYSFEEVGDRLWLAADGHASFIQKGTTNQTNCDALLNQITPNSLYVNSLSYLKGHIWLATRVGLYRVDGDKPILVSRPDLDVLNVQLVGEEIWLATTKGAYPLATMKRTPDQELEVRRIEYINGQIWLATSRGAYRIDETRTVRTYNKDLSVRAVKLINGKIWLGTESGLYIYGGSTFTLMSNKHLYVNNIVYLDGQTWLATDKGAFLFEASSFKPLLRQRLNVRDVQRIKGKIWLATGAAAHANETVDAQGLFRVDEDVSISITPYSANNWWTYLVKLVRDDVLVEGVARAKVQYIRRPDGKDPYDDQAARHFEVILTPSEAEFKKAVQDKQYSPADSFERYLPSGRATIYLSVRDQWKNEFESKPISSWVIPGPLGLSSLLGVFWLMLLGITFGLAPYSEFCNRVLMNPYVRKLGSFGLVPLILTVFPPMRRYLLRRYLREIRGDQDFAEWQTRFVVPTEDFLPERMGKQIKDNRVLFLVGESGIGKTSYFKYLAGYYASDANKELDPGGVVPVFLPLKRYRGKALKDVFTAQLAKYGHLTDTQLTERFLWQGDFLILIDGLNEVNEETLADISSFVDELRKANYFYLGSQETYPDFKGIVKTVTLHALGEEKIRQIIRLRLDQNKADSIIKKFDANTYKEYGIPQDLELAIELINKGQPLPLSKLALYEATLKPIFDSWLTSGRVNYKDLLCRRSYEMLSSLTESFDREESPLPEEIRNGLVEDKFLIFRGGHYQFRHDLIRAYLAAKYFGPRWPELFKEQVTVDSNWRSMMEFVILRRRTAEETRDLLYAILEKSHQVAKDLFNWVETEHPELCRAWADEFDRRYGKATRK